MTDNTTTALPVNDGIPDSRGRSDGGKTPDNDGHIVTAEEELAALKARLADESRKRAEEALLKELYPEVECDKLPEAVCQEAATAKIPLAAAYALYLRRRELAQAEGKIAARTAASESAGELTGSCGEVFYSIDEIRAMSRKEIRRSYKAILRSLEKGQSSAY